MPPLGWYVLLFLITCLVRIGVLQGYIVCSTRLYAISVLVVAALPIGHLLHRAYSRTFYPSLHEHLHIRNKPAP